MAVQVRRAVARMRKGLEKQLEKLRSRASALPFSDKLTRCSPAVLQAGLKRVQQHMDFIHLLKRDLSRPCHEQVLLALQHRVR
jgi:hypothetical protein